MIHSVSMNKNLKLLRNWAVLLLLSVVCSCGGGGGGDGGGGTPAPGATGKTISGYVYDGYITGATVVIKDTSGDVLATTTSDLNGSYTAEIPNGTADTLLVEATGGNDLGEDGVINGVVPDIANTVPLAAVVQPTAGLSSVQSNLSLITTLLHRLVAQGMEPAAASAVVQQLLSLSAEEIAKLPASDIKVYRANGLVRDMVTALAKINGNTIDSTLTLISSTLLPGVTGLLDGDGKLNKDVLQSYISDNSPSEQKTQAPSFADIISASYDMRDVNLTSLSSENEQKRQALTRMVFDALLAKQVTAPMSGSSVKETLAKISTALAPSNTAKLVSLNLTDPYAVQQTVTAVYNGYIPATVNGKISAASGSSAGVIVAMAGGNSTLTSPDGTFTLINVREGAQLLLIQAPGGSNISLPVAALTAGETRNLGTVEISRGVPADTGNEVTPVVTDTSTSLTQKATLSGNVSPSLLSLNQLVAKLVKLVMPKVTSQEGGLWLTSDKVLASVETAEQPKMDNQSIPAPMIEPIKVPIHTDGSFEVPNLLSSGNYTLTFVDGAGSGTQIKDIALTPGSKVERVIDQVKPTGSVRVAIQSLSSGVRLAGATVKLLETGITAVSDPDTGLAQLTSLPEGDYSLIVSLTGYVPRYMTFKVSSGQDSDLQVIELNDVKGSLKGTVSIEGVTDLSNIIVFVKGKDGSLYTALTDTTGSYKIPALPAGSGYSVISYAHDYQAAKADNIEVMYGAENVVPVINLTRLSNSMGSLAGFARFGDKSEFMHAGIIIALEGTDLEAVTARDGSYVLNNIPPGRYTINFIDSNYKVTTSIGVKIVAGETTKLPDTQLDRKSGIIKGRVILENRTDHGGIKVTLNGTDYQTTTDNTGNWQLTAPTGNFGGITCSVSYFETKSFNSTVTVTETGIFYVGELTLKQVAASVTGSIAVAGAPDFTKTRVTFQGISGSAQGTELVTSTDAGGNLTTGALPLGGYIVTISYPGGSWETITTNVTLSSGTQSVSIGNMPVRMSYVKINGDNVYTNNREVTLAIGNSDAVKMQITEGGTTYPEEPYATSKTLVLGAGDGTRTVSIAFTDASGKTLPSVSDTIVLDTTLTISSFTATGALKKGDTLHFRVAAGEPGGTAYVTLPGVVEKMPLRDDGVGGDVLAGDGIYERDFGIATPYEINAAAEVTFTDRAGNVVTMSSSAPVVLSTPPPIRNLQVTSNIALGQMTITFSTDEPAKSLISYGDSFGTLSNVKDISTLVTENHTVTLTGLAANAVTYFEVKATDAASNSSAMQGQGKLAPPPPASLSVSPGNNEIGVVWSAVATSNFAGYNLYRAEASGAFIKVNTAGLITDCYYLDSGTLNGTSYQYMVTAQDKDGNESAKSTMAGDVPSATLAGPTEINGGVIDINTIWLKSRSPYRITGNLKVKSGASLVLLPGCEVNLVGDDRFVQVDGQLFGFGKSDNRVTLKAIDFANNKAGAFKFNDLAAPSYLDHVNISYINMSHFDPSSSYSSSTTTPLDVAHSTLNFDDSKGSFTIAVNKLEYSSVATSTTDNMGAATQSSLSVKTAFNSNITQTSTVKSYDGSDYYAGSCTLLYIQGCLVEGGNYTVTTAEGSTLKNARFSFYGTNSGGMNYVTPSLKNSNVINSTISQNSMSSDKFTANYNAFDVNSSFKPSGAGAVYDISANYWGTMDTLSIMTRTGHVPGATKKLYPAISTVNIFTADFDGDGIPDYLDQDNDNDGYSDLQEDRESDPQFGVSYNPLDKNSHPNSLKDNDMDTIPDDTDQDNDNDGLSNYDEIQKGTNPMIADTDGDGVNDGDEVAFKYDPLNKNNFPLFGTISGLVIDGSNANSEGFVYIGKSLTCNSCTVSKGVKIVLNKDVYVYFNNGRIDGTKSEPVLISQAGSNTGISFTGTAVEYAVISATNISAYQGTTIRNADIKAASGFTNYGSISESFIDCGSNGSNNGLINHSYIKGGISAHGGGMYGGSVSVITGSYLENLYFNGGSIKLSVVKTVNLYQPGTGASIEDSIISTGYASQDAALQIIRSDVSMGYMNTNAPLFFDGSYLYCQPYSGTPVFFDGLGTPADTKGDGLAETQFSIITGTVPTTVTQTYTFDGVTNPRNTPNFPNGEADLWNPAGVGCQWTPAPVAKMAINSASAQPSVPGGATGGCTLTPGAKFNIPIHFAVLIGAFGWRVVRRRRAVN